MSRTATGLRAWVLQRVTAVYIGIFSIYLLGVLLISPPADWPEWRALFATASMSIAAGLYLLAILLHAWVGVRDILIDYVKPFGPRLILLSLVGLVLLGCGLWGLQTLMLLRLN